jgi:uncharacterized membrane protein
MARPRDLEEKGTHTHRIEALSDGVFAIALTLLVLELKIPEVGEGLSQAQTTDALVQALVGLLPKVWVYVLTFLLIGIYWIAHHNAFRHIECWDRHLLFRNLYFLMFVSLLPFTSALMGSYSVVAVAWIIYSCNMMAIGLTLLWLWRYAYRQKLFNDETTEREVTFFTARSLVTPSVFLLSAVLALIDVRIAWWIPLLVWPAQTAIQRYFGRNLQ